MEEKTTLRASLALVISLKSEKINAQVFVFAVPTAVFIYKIIRLQRYSPSYIFATN